MGPCGRLAVGAPADSWRQWPRREEDRDEGDDAFGFLCIVDTDRDRPQALGADELAALRAHPLLASKIKTASSS